MNSSAITAAAALGAARAADFADVRALAGGSAPILVLAPHPDDESLGCGGLIAACAANVIPVDVVLLTDGEGSHPGSRTMPPPALARLRLQETNQALAALGLDAGHLHRMGWPDAHAPIAGCAFASAVAHLTGLARRSGARTIVAAWGADPHCDHRAGAAIAAAAAAMIGARHLAYPVWGWLLEDAAPVVAGPALRLDMAEFLPMKRIAVACHRSQHGGIVGDSPDAFVLPQALLDACLRPTESFFDQTETPAHL